LSMHRIFDIHQFTQGFRSQQWILLEKIKNLLPDAETITTLTVRLCQKDHLYEKHLLSGYFLSLRTTDK
ncbi:MAG TPA: hypothetical protein VMS95_00470, partial [Candidatus Krumholzibacteriaceae bacterium]|nr:hypothetical protein [Candidatus Krumholzibacteriaceae bacterium]